MSKGHQYENEMAAKLYWNTQPGVFVARCGYSGNGALPQPDVVVRDASLGEAHGIELKKRDPKKNKDGTFKPVTILDPEGISQLKTMAQNAIVPWVAVKFTYRELLVFEIDGADWIENIPDCFEPRMVNGNLKLRKPSTDEWESTTSGRDDVDVLIDALDLPTPAVTTNTF